jgi:hypothetical protein
MSAKRLSHLSVAALLFLLSACGDQNPAAPTFSPSAVEPKLVLLDGLASITGQFSGAINSTGVNPQPIFCGPAPQLSCTAQGLPATPRAQVRWGTPTVNIPSQKSGLGLDGATGVTIETNVPFMIGTLTHFNFPVTNGATTVTLTFNVSLPGVNGFTESFPVRFDVDETPNAAPCKYVTAGPACADRITWALPQPTAIRKNGNVYALNIKGFRTTTSTTSPALDGFTSDEGQQTVAYLFAEVADATAQTHAKDDSYSIEVGDVLTVAAGGVRDNDVGVVSVLVATPPEHGALALAPNGGFVYTPNADFGGDDSFVYFGRLANGELSLATVTVHILDTTAPSITAPADITVEATSAAGTVVDYGGATAIDAVDGSIVPSCAPASGSTFAIGTTDVSCTATDAAGNSASATFKIHLVDTTAPLVSPRPDVIVEATSAAGAVASWAPVTATDLVDGTVVASCTPASGSAFAMGPTVVRCTASDAAGNASATSFIVRVEDHTAPALSLPANITIYPRTAGGGTATYAATAHDLVSGAVPVACTPVSGSFFTAGTTTTVTCSATDGAGNTAKGSFTVRVRTIEELLDLLVLRSRGIGQGRNLEMLAGNIRASFLRGNERASCGQLGAYLSQAGAQTAQLTTSQVVELTELATLIQRIIGC